jgi:ferredoxin-type protein NapH
MRQRLRNAILLVSLLAFPITLNYFSPYLSLSGAAVGLVSASLLVFGGQFLSSLVVGRAFCGWLCPAGCLQDITMKVNDRRRPHGHWVKFLIWGPWFGSIVFLAAKAGGFKRLDPLYMMPNGISVSEPVNYMMYYSILALFLGLAFASGRHAFCHYGCWMAPFMMAGRKFRNLGRWPSLMLRADASKCLACGACTRTCPMSIDVREKVRQGDMEHSDCILCGRCVDGCDKDAIRYGFGRSKAVPTEEGRGRIRDAS